MVDVRPVETDEQMQRYLDVLAEVEPTQRALTVAEMRAKERPGRTPLLVYRGEDPVASGFVDRSGLAGRAFVMPRVRPAFRRQGIGTVVLGELLALAEKLERPVVRSMADDPGSVEFGLRFGFTEVDRQVEQLRSIGQEPPPTPPAGVSIVSIAQQPDLWRPAYDAVGVQGFADLALTQELKITAEEWMAGEMNNPSSTFVALHGTQIIGVAGLLTDQENPHRAEHGLTAVRREWRGKGVASALKRQCLAWAAANGLTEVYTWTQRNNADMRRLNEHLGFRYGLVSVSLEAPMPPLAHPAQAE
jgi:GNAT superfamily N-acetyltransferase